MVLGKDGWCWERMELRKDEREIKVQPTNRNESNEGEHEKWGKLAFYAQPAA